MAQSPSHTFGQKIGELLEELLRPLLAKVAGKHGLYLDYKHPRPARKNRKNVGWQDSKNNRHNLDFVLEFGGSETEIGVPKAFIECAWRSYTKHSRNKAQELQGAIVPLSETYSQSHPFLGAVLAGVFTAGSLQQLRSHNFGILFFSQQSVVSAFAKAGIDANFGEETPDDDVRAKLEAYQRLNPAGRRKIIDALKRHRSKEIQVFINSLEDSLTRRLVRIVVMALHGPVQEVVSAEEAIRFVEQYREDQSAKGFVCYQLVARYSNGDNVNGEFKNKRDAVAFLRGLR